MSFDPFGDAKTQGYLRNIHGLPIGKRLKNLEHQEFSTFLTDALAGLEELSDPGYDDLLNVHRKLFGDLYPWAGQDRFALFPCSVVSKGRTTFAFSDHIRKAFEYGLDHNHTPGQTLGHWAYAHPFLEGNGRALFTFFDDHLRRKSLQLDWAALDEKRFLRALDAQISTPRGATLDLFLKPHLSSIDSDQSLSSTLPNVKWWRGIKN